MSTPTIVTHPMSMTVSAGVTVTFSVTATSDVPTLTYQWQFGGGDLPGETLSTLTILTASDANAGDYTVTASNGVNPIVSNIATLTVGKLHACMHW